MNFVSHVAHIVYYNKKRQHLHDFYQELQFSRKGEGPPRRPFKSGARKNIRAVDETCKNCRNNCKLPREDILPRRCLAEDKILSCED